MGKIYEVESEEIAIVDGKLVGCTVIDNFSSQNDTTKEARKLEGVTFSLDGLDVETMIKFLWDACKVKAQARCFKDMSDVDFLALDGGNHNILDFIATKDRTSTKVAILNKVKASQMKKFYEKAMEKAVESLGVDAVLEDVSAWASKYYDAEYKDIVEDM